MKSSTDEVNKCSEDGSYRMTVIFAKCGVYKLSPFAQSYSALLYARAETQLHLWLHSPDEMAYFDKHLTAIF